MDPAGLAALRGELNRLAEASGREERTAAFLAARLRALRPARLLTGLGGRGLAAVFAGAAPGRRLLLRAELDAIPVPGGGVAHRCGHDGHMAMLLGLAAELAHTPPARGEAILLFQPAEEDGSGAARVVADPAYASLAPDLAFALHNLPGLPLGQVACGPGNLASLGLALGLTGRPSHAAHPEEGLSPAPALARLLREIPALAARGGPHGLITITHARLGAPAFGSSPGEAELFATLRAGSDPALADLAAAVLALAAQAAGEAGLALAHRRHDPFPALRNHPAAVARLREAAAIAGLAFLARPEPYRWSEDFGHFLAGVPGALFCLGAGEDHPPLHAADYQFPDALLPLGVVLWHGLVRAALA